jgi:hypothetical protein
MNNKTVDCWIKDKEALIVPIGDIHLGDGAFSSKSEEKLRGYIKWVKERKNARVILMGDIFNVATRISKTSPFQNMTLKEEMLKAIELFTPIKGQILGAIEGNHEARAEDFMDYSPTIPFCEKLGIRYLKYSAVFKMGVGVNKRKTGCGDSPATTYLIYAHHTTGGGATMGGKINRVTKLKDIIINADIYLGAHNHGLVCTPIEGYMVDSRSGYITRFRQYMIDCGGYLDWNDSYAEQKMLAPLKIGSPILRLNGYDRDVRVTL